MNLHKESGLNNKNLNLTIELNSKQLKLGGLYIYIIRCTVGVSFAASIVRNIDAADNEGIPRFEAMKVKSMADAER